MELAILSALTVVLITQLFRQLLPNLFAFLWQLSISNVIPKRYLSHRWLMDKESLFYKKEGEITLTRYPFFSHSNLRGVVLLFGLVVAVCINIPTHDLKENWQALESLYLAVLLIVVFMGSIVGWVKGVFNPDVFVWGFFNFMSFIVAFDFVVKTFF